MRILILGLASIVVSSGAIAQVSTTAKETGKATAETTRQAGDEVKGAMSSEPNKSIDKAKAKTHKANAKHHAHAAKDAAKDTVK